MVFKKALICLFVSVLLSTSGCTVEIIHDLQETEANEILTALEEQKIQCKKHRSTQGRQASYTISVSRDEATKAWKVLRQKNLPRPSRKGFGEIFGKKGLIPTANQERALMHHAIAGELSMTLQRVDGILEARVHVVLPSRDPLVSPDAPKPIPKASVLLLVGKRSPLSKNQTAQLVAGAVQGLEPKNVSVLIVSGQHQAGTFPKKSAGAGASMVSVGPFEVAASSSLPLLLTLIVCLLVMLALGLWTFLLLRRIKTLTKHIDRSISTDDRSMSDLHDSSLNLFGQTLTRSQSSIGGENDTP